MHSILRSLSRLTLNHIPATTPTTSAGTRSSPSFYLGWAPAWARPSATTATAACSGGTALRSYDAITLDSASDEAACSPSDGPSTPEPREEGMRGTREEGSSNLRPSPIPVPNPHPRHSLEPDPRGGFRVFPGLDLITGPMFSGKTTELLRRMDEYEVRTRGAWRSGGGRGSAGRDHDGNHQDRPRLKRRGRG